MRHYFWRDFGQFLLGAIIELELFPFWLQDFIELAFGSQSGYGHPLTQDALFAWRHFLLIFISQNLIDRIINIDILRNSIVLRAHIHGFFEMVENRSSHQEGLVPAPQWMLLALISVIIFLLFYLIQWVLTEFSSF